MAQSRYKKLITKMVRKRAKGYPIATIAFYGPNDKIATKLVCAIMPFKDAEPEPLKKWFASSDLRKSESVLKEVFEFISDNGAKTVGMTDGIIGCPHEEGIDYPLGEACPKCPFWDGRDRFSGERWH
ncbi:hypothetical protein [Vibrio tritonius]|uniref:hypothetical protein n=1 Tax=Vibrio tritonius TaxID=1435069 RepID=UPI00315C6FF0